MAIFRAKNGPTAAGKKSSFRGDIQGLRAIAVVSVIADHLFHWPAGGFIGVDVFFVISGFLITGLLIREYRTTGSLSFGSFYRRRIKRIAPAATLVLIVTVAASSILLNVGRANQTFIDAIWAFFFVGNWRFAFSGTDYFQASGPVSPLQHFWSLAIEEQFYFIWPWLMLLIFWVGARSTKWTERIAMRALATAMSFIVVASFIWSVNESLNAPTWAYFSTLSRAWELGIGALLAVATPILMRIPNHLRPFMAWIGIAGIGISLFAISAESIFPAPWGAVPVLATALVIAAGTGGDRRYLTPLANRVTSYVGDVSYSLYLWHFPVIIFLEALVPAKGIMFYAFAVALMSFLAVTAFELVENPIRRSAWLEKRPRQRNRVKTVGAGLRVKVFGMIALTVVSGTLISMAIVIQRPTAESLEASSLQPVPAEVSAEPAELSTRQAELVRSSLLSSWPEMDPGIDVLADARAPEWESDNCLDVDESNMSDCIYGEGDNLAVLLGDSVSISYMPAIRAAIEKEGWRIQVLTRHQCPGIDASVRGATGEKSLDAECDAHHAWVEGILAELQPNLIIVSSAEDSLRRLDSGVEGTAAAAAEWLTVSQQSLTKLSALGGRTVLLSSPPQGKPITTCATQINGPADCNSSTRGTLWAAMTAAERAATESVLAATLPVKYVNTGDWFCTAEDRCPALFGTTPIRVDANHLTGAYASTLSEEMRAALLD